MKQILAIQILVLAIGSALAQSPGATNAPVKPENLSPGRAMTNAAPEVLTEAETSLFGGRSLDLFTPGPAWEVEPAAPAVSGPLIEPFITTRPLTVPRRLLELVNPFAPVKPSPDTQHRGAVKGLSSRSWTSVVGWRPGRSEFPDETTHEPKSALIIFKCPTDPGK